MSRIITHADVAEIPDGGVLYLPPGGTLTPLAQERVRARGITVQDGPPGDPTGFVQAVAQRVIERLGAVAPEQVDRVVAEVLRAVEAPAQPDPAHMAPSAEYCAAYIEQERARARRRAVITTTGRNRKGIVARLTVTLADLGCDILDISQTLVGDYFTMILVVDTMELGVSFAEFKAAIEAVGQEMGFQSMVMHEDIVTALSRV